MATLKVRICVRCEENRFSEIPWHSIRDIENFLSEQMELLMKQWYGRKVKVEQVLVERNPFDVIDEDEGDIKEIYD